MNPLLENKLFTLKQSNEFECWYLVKHSTNFAHLCYLVSFLKDFVEHPGVSKNLETHIDKKATEINTLKPELKISNNYRALRVAAFFGLIKMRSSSYAECRFTKTYEEICSRCGGIFEKTELYQDIITRQVEKMFISSSIDEGKNNVRKDYSIFPIMFLDKILLEIGKVTNNYSISMNEYRYFVATAKKFDDYLDTMLYIKLLREECNEQYGTDTVLDEFKKLRDKFDNRMNKAIELLDYIDCSNDRITLKQDKIEEVAQKVYEFEKTSHEMTDDEYIEFLCSTRSLFDMENQGIDENILNEDKEPRLTGAENIILYGVPGAGKSYTIKHEYCDDEECMERLVFHPDYTYSDFVGQIMPKISPEKNVTYEFTAGPFTKIVKKAYENPDKMFYLVIEEINRGNAPAIFGDIFQLLDRQGKKIKDKSSGELVDNPNYGASEYAITNADIAKEVYGNGNHKVSLPSNLSILCTMNTSDQNVFTLDTAFQRRWSMRLIRNQFPEDGSEKEFANTRILDTDVTWEKFFTVINDLILTKNIRMTSAEDKRLGTHFVSQEDLKYDDYEGDNKDIAIVAMRQNRRFAEKVLKYMWDDAFKFNKDDVFDINKVNSLEKVILLFTTKKGNERFAAILKDTVYKSLIPEQQ